MGHQSNDAGKALRAYARDLHSTAGRGGFVSSVGTSKQDDAPNQFLGSGAPHQLAIAAAVVCVVLLGGIGLAAATNPANLPKTGLASPAPVEAASLPTLFIDAEGFSTVNAIRALNDLALPRAAAALDAALGAGVDSSPSVQVALSHLYEVINARLDTADAVNQSDVTISLAISDLESAIRPPGLNIDRVPPGHGGIPPGLDDAWLEQVKDRQILRPTDLSVLIPQGRDKADAPDKGRDSAPGQTKEKPKKGDGKP